MDDEAAGPADVLAFWRAAGPQKWFEKDAGFDAAIRSRFLATYEAAVAGRLAAWQATPEGTLALLIVLDQFPRNMFRADARTYAADPLARALAGAAIDRGFDQRATHSERRFYYLPFMHSETMVDQERCLRLAQHYADPEFLQYAEQHADIVRRFGRFPHRNTMLGRPTTPEEQAFLDQGGFAG